LPREAYGRAKLEIEQALTTAAQETGHELVILRPPLVYGPAVKANFRALIRLAASGLPLPFAGIANRRSLIFLDNLVDAAVHAALHPAAAGHVLLARDEFDLSTEELIRQLAEGLGRPARIFAMPQAVPRGLSPPPGPRRVLRSPDAVVAGRRQRDTSSARLGAAGFARKRARGDGARLSRGEVGPGFAPSARKSSAGFACYSRRAPRNMSCLM